MSKYFMFLLIEIMTGTAWESSFFGILAMLSHVMMTLTLFIVLFFIAKFYELEGKIG